MKDITVTLLDEAIEFTGTLSEKQIEKAIEIMNNYYKNKQS